MPAEPRPRVVVLDERLLVREALVELLVGTDRWRVAGWDGAGAAPAAALWVTPHPGRAPAGRAVSLEHLSVEDGDGMRAAVRAALADFSTAPATPAAPPDAPVPLSAHEAAVLDCLGAGCTVPAAAARLGVSPASVRNATRRLYRKLGAHSQAEAVALAARSENRVGR